jgi:hypothetical protein
MTKDKEMRLRRMVLCGKYATKVLEATVFERLSFLVQLRVALWRLRWTSQVASLGADTHREGPVECNEMRAAEA